MIASIYLLVTGLRPVIDLSVHGANIVIALREDGTIQVQGVALSQNAASGGTVEPWVHGFLVSPTLRSRTVP